MTTMLRNRVGRLAVAGVAAATMLTLAPVTALAAPTGPIAQGGPVLPQATCTPNDTLTLFNFNDFHGRTDKAAALFTPVEQARAAQGADKVLLLSAGDNIGGSTFVSASQQDVPTLDILKAAKVDAVASGNHEFDQGWPDLRDRVIPAVSSVFPILAANVTDSSGQVPSPLKAYTVIEKGGLKIGVVGAVTAGLPGLVSPAGLEGLTIGDPVDAVNKVAAQLKDGDPANGEADIVIAEFHEGAADGTTTAQANAATSTAFAKIYSGLSTNSDVVMNGHTHQAYSWTTSDGRPLMSAGEYGTKVSKLTMSVDTTSKKLCSTAAASLTPPAAGDTSLPAIAAIKQIHDTAAAKAKVIGAEVIGSTTAPITRGFTGADAGARNNEGALNNLVAQMFYDTLAKGNPEFIGIQNPGGTRADLASGDITYEQAATVLPFANTLMTAKVTGAEFKQALEQQWQRLPDGSVPPRPYLQLGLSKNVRYTYDESLDEGKRITGVWINNRPLDPAKSYTFGSGSFLVAGGDQFYALGKQPQSRTDSGQVDLQAWVAWLKANKPVTPSFARRGVTATKVPTALTEGVASSAFSVGVPKAGGVAPDTLNLTSTGATANQTLIATVKQGAVTVEVGQATITAGKVENLQVRIPWYSSLASGPATLELRANPTGTLATFEITVTMTKGVPAGGVFGDIDGDKRADLWQVDNSDQLIMWRGGPTTITKVGQTGQIPAGATALIKVGDLNGDGRQDALVRMADSNMYLFHGTANGGLKQASRFGQRWGALDKLFYIEGLGGAPTTKYLIGRAGDGRLLRYTITSTGLGYQTTIGTGWGGMSQIFSVGDFSGDGRPDVLALRAVDSSLHLYTSNAAGALTHAGQVGANWQGFSHAFSPGDLNGDGRKDLIGVNGKGDMFAYTNRAPKSWGPATKVATGFTATDLLA